ncbi:MAG: hypothetical protein IH831_08440 [Planctomycetes bacterium]|nr:hypothetical protein [Planctomycetota bacterium]
MTFPDYLVLAIYFLLLSSIGYICMRRVKGQEDFFLGSRGFGKLLQTFAAFGAGTGSSDPINTGRTTFTSGMSGMWSVMYWLFVTPFYWITAVWYRRMRHTTLGDWFTERYESRRLGVAYALFGIFFIVAYGSMLFSAIGKVAAPLVGTGSIETGASMKDIGIIIGLFVGGPLRLVVTVLTVVIRTFVSFGRIALAFFRPFHEGFKQVAGGFLDLITGVGSFKDAVVRIFSGLEQVMTAPIRGAINAILKMMEQVIVSPALAPLFSKLGLSPETLAGDLSALSEKIATAPIFESSEATKALKRDKRQRAAATSLEIPPIELPAAEDSTICVNAELHVDGEEMAIATTRASSELAERAGARISPWQKRQILERGGIAFTAR